MAFEGTDAERWAVVEAPVLQPAEDFLTKSPNGPFIDTGINVAFERRGRIYLAKDTIREMAEVLGLFDADKSESQEMHDRIQYLAGFRDGLNEGGKTNDILNRITAVLGSVPAVADGGSAAVVEVTNDAAESAGENVTDVREPATGSGSKGRKASSVSGKRGSNDVPGVSGDAERYRI